MEFHLAQLNIAKMKMPLEDPSMQDFVDNLDNINALADSSPGFVWRLKDEDDNATNISVFDDDTLLVNLSVWDSVESLKKFVYETQHAQILRRKKEWFDRIESAYLVLWWITAGHTPSVSEAESRLTYLREHGETVYAFSFRNVFDADQASLTLP